jgi:hypothetical protein
MAKYARKLAGEKYNRWSQRQLSQIHREELESSPSKCNVAGVFLITGQNVGVYAGEAENLREHLRVVLDNPQWRTFDPDVIFFQENDQDFSQNYALKSVLVRKDTPLLNSKIWMRDEPKKQKTK